MSGGRVSLLRTAETRMDKGFAPFQADRMPPKVPPSNFKAIRPGHPIQLQPQWPSPFGGRGIAATSGGAKCNFSTPKKGAGRGFQTAPCIPATFDHRPVLAAAAICWHGHQNKMHIPQAVGVF